MAFKFGRFPLLIGLLVSGLLGLLAVQLVGAQSNAWPTPPPAPLGPPPRIETNIQPVNVPNTLGAIRWVIQPRSLPGIPAIPPLSSDIFAAPTGLNIIIEAGSLDRTIQLIHAPVDNLSTTGRFQRLLAAFDLTAYDYQGQEIQPNLRRPWIMDMPLSQLSGPTGDPTRLVFARWQNGQWMPLITTFFRDDNTLSAHILETGRFAILAELRPN